MSACTCLAFAHILVVGELLKFFLVVRAPAGLRASEAQSKQETRHHHHVEEGETVVVLPPLQQKIVNLDEVTELEFFRCFAHAGFDLDFVEESEALASIVSSKRSKQSTPSTKSKIPASPLAKQLDLTQLTDTDFIVGSVTGTKPISKTHNKVMDVEPKGTKHTFLLDVVNTNNATSVSGGVSTVGMTPNSSNMNLAATETSNNNNTNATSR